MFEILGAIKYGYKVQVQPVQHMWNVTAEGRLYLHPKATCVHITGNIQMKTQEAASVLAPATQLHSLASYVALDWFIWFY